jgi:hypothetical protein
MTSTTESADESQDGLRYLSRVSAEIATRESDEARAEPAGLRSWMETEPGNPLVLSDPLVLSLMRSLEAAGELLKDMQRQRDAARGEVTALRGGIERLIEKPFQWGSPPISFVDLQELRDLLGGAAREVNVR